MLTCWVATHGRMASQSLPEVVVAPGADRPAVGVPQQGPAWGEATPAFPVGQQMRHQGGGYGLPAHRLAFLVQLDKTMLGIQVFRHARQGTAAAAGGLGMQPQEESIEGRVISCSRGDTEDLFEAAVWQCGARAAQPARLGRAYRTFLYRYRDLLAQVHVREA
jgi:hypothetical protein